METIAEGLVATVCGGHPSTTTARVQLGPFYLQASVSRSEYQGCIASVVQRTAQQYPSTNPWYWPFGEDRNAIPRTRATLANMRQECGLPRHG